MSINISNNVDMGAFLKRHDILWERKPKAWDEGPFIGNGLIGATVYFNHKNRLTLAIGDTSVYDNRLPTEKEKSSLFLTPRLPIGNFNIGGVTGAASMQLELYDAICYGWSKTMLDTYKYKCFAPHGKRMIIFETMRDFTDCRFDWESEGAESPRQKRLTRLKSDRRSKDYPPPKKPYSYQHRDICYCIQPLYNEGYYIVAYKTVPTDSGVRMFITIGQGTKETLITQKLAYELNLAVVQYNKILEDHLEYWHNFYKKSFVSLNDAELEEFYWIQLYKLASAGCENGRVYDTCGPWLTNNTAWPGTWWNLNVQLTYSPLPASNHTELMMPLESTLKKGINELIENVPPVYRYDSAAIGRVSTETLYSPVSEPGDKDAEDETGNLIWAIHTLYLKYLMTQDCELLETVIYPILKRAVNYYLHFLRRDEKNILHLPQTLSPEYPLAGSDTNYDLALLKWGLITLNNICDTLEIKDEKYDERTWVYEHLADYPTESGKGFKIAEEVPYERSHRHYSHLLMIYPLHTLDLNDKKNRKLAKNSIEYWQSKPEALQGYSQTGAASMYACLGDGNKAYTHLTKLWADGFIRPNTMYHEGGCPVLETPCAAACSILDMLIQSFGGVINILPAIPDVWTDITFDNLLCEGGFEVSAVMRDKKLKWCKIYNKYSKDGICIIKAPFQEKAEIQIYTDTFSQPVENIQKGIKIKIPKNQGIVFADAAITNMEISPVTMSDKGCHVYGFNKNSIIKA